MDLSRFDWRTLNKTRLRDFLQAKYANKKIDVAVAILPPAFDFLMAYGDLIFPGTPIVFCGVDRAQLGNRDLPPNVRGVLIKREFAPTLELALRLHPATEGVVVVSGHVGIRRQYSARRRKTNSALMRTGSRSPTFQNSRWTRFACSFRNCPPKTSSSSRHCFKMA